MVKTSYNDKEHSDGNHRRAAKPSEGFFCIEHSRYVEHSDSPQKYYVAAPLRCQEHREHGEYRYDSDPRIDVKS